MIVFLHPVFTIVAIVLIAYSILEVYNNRNYKSVWAVVIAMILLIGLRKWIGADYGVYARLYTVYSEKVVYSQLFNMAMFKPEDVDMEWLYLLSAKVFYQLGAPFFIFTLIIAILSIGLKFFAFEKISPYPALTMALYMFPTYFIADGGQMRQGVSMAFLMISFIFIMKRNLLAFLFIIYIAMGFHKSAFIFVFAYWLVLIPFNSKTILALILICMALSPFQVYSYISLLDSIAPEEVFEGYRAYETSEDSNSGSIKLYDLICIFYTYFLVTYNKEACEKIPYYEYMRNIGVVGICMYFIFRSSPIFSSRLSINYFIFMIVVLPNIVAAVRDLRLRKGLHLTLVIYIVFYYFVFAYMQGVRAGYTIEYRNYLW